jgi:hypothetical protein
VTCESARESAAVALLTGEPLGPDVEAHLDGCELCAAEVGRLRPLPALLATAPADVDELLSAPPPGDALLERLLAAARRRKAARRRTTVLAVAAAVVLLLVLPLGAWFVASRSAPSAIDRSVTNTATGVSGRVQLVPGDWGSNLTMDINGVGQGTRCTLVVVTDTGARQTAATWEANYAGTAQVRGTVAASVDHIKQVDVVDDRSGKVLLAVPVPGG